MSRMRYVIVYLIPGRPRPTPKVYGPFSSYTAASRSAEVLARALKLSDGAPDEAITVEACESAAT